MKAGVIEMVPVDLSDQILRAMGFESPDILDKFDPIVLGHYELNSADSRKSDGLMEY